MSRWQVGLLGVAGGVLAATLGFGVYLLVTRDSKEQGSTAVHARSIVTTTSTRAPTSTTVAPAITVAVTAPSAAAPPITLTNPVDLRAAFDTAARDTIGHFATEADAADFIAAYHEQERAFQSGRSPFRPSDPYRSAVAFLRERYPIEAGATAAVPLFEAAEDFILGNPRSTASTVPANATGVCNDGTYAFSYSPASDCSTHRGIRAYL